MRLPPLPPAILPPDLMSDILPISWHKRIIDAVGVDAQHAHRRPAKPGRSERHEIAKEQQTIAPEAHTSGHPYVAGDHPTQAGQIRSTTWSSGMRPLSSFLAVAVGSSFLPLAAFAQMVGSPADLHHYNVTVRRFDPTQGPMSGQLFVLPVDGPDAEHAIASTIANAAAFSKKTEAGQVQPVAFMAVKVEPRR